MHDEHGLFVYASNDLILTYTIFESYKIEYEEQVRRVLVLFFLLAAEPVGVMGISIIHNYSKYAGISDRILNSG